MTTAQLEKENVRDVTPPPAPASAGAVLAGTPNSSGRSSGRKRRPGCDAVLHAGNEQAKALSDPPTKRWRAAPPSPAPPLWQTEESPAAAAASVGQQAKQQQPLGEGAARPATGSLDLEQQEAAQVPSPAEGGSKREAPTPDCHADAAAGAQQQVAAAPPAPTEHQAALADVAAAGAAAAAAAADQQAAAAAAADAERAALPDWCNRPVMPMLPEDVQQVDCFYLLPGHPLLALACEGQAALLAKVLEHGADPDARDSWGYTALHMACRHARLACVRCLLEAGASQLPDADGLTPAQLAAAAGHADVAAMIEQHAEVQAALAAQRAAQSAGEAAAADGQA